MKPSLRTRRKRPKTTAGSEWPPVTRFLALLAVLVLFACTSAAQNPKPKKGEAQPRSLTGMVTTPDDKPAVRAVVLLENTKTKAIISFYSQQDGTYFFHELSPDVDYKISAKLDDAVSPTRTLSSFDGRKDAVINLKLEKKKE
jgi:hypothetical protein